MLGKEERPRHRGIERSSCEKGLDLFPTEFSDSLQLALSVGEPSSEDTEISWSLMPDMLDVEPYVDGGGRQYPGGDSLEGRCMAIKDKRGDSDDGKGKKRK
ncbi:hypothetical protein E2I00_002645 [Balaenoptera physalus]|uniref:Uncharacterized protein n=1 Tax=Balaenoptera physalus TaxID=9770 RepID=A0A643BNI3_BALPH|nr:hypothetical protein E2I00_002645 [Balaenoptera physalus]